MKKYLVFITSVFCAIGVLSCKKETISQNSQKKIILDDSKHIWYYFQNGKLNKTSKISEVPVYPKKAWTESVRVSSFGCIPEENSANSKKAYALVNKIGILEFDEENIEIYKDESFFFGKTAGNLVFWENTPLFSVYKNTVFSDSSIKTVTSNKNHYFLLQFNPQTKMILPVINIDNLCFNDDEIEKSKNIEITDFIWDGQTWTLCKKENSTPIHFSYMTFQPKKEITSISPTNANQMLHKTISDEETFRKLQSQIDFIKGPERLQSLLSSMKDNSSFNIDCITCGGKSKRNYKNQIQGKTDSLNGYAILSDTWCACLFEDGTMFLNGALSHSRIINKGKNIAFKLPKMPAGFIYTGFVFSGKTLHAFWEEKEFYKTGRSGLLTVSLNPIISKIEEKIE